MNVFYIFRRLAEVSRLTRGVVVLISDIHYAKLVMDEAKRLNMLDGHFFWLWLDASSEFDVFQNIVNSTQYTEDSRHDSASLSYKDEAFYNSFERSKRDDADNNSIVDANYSSSIRYNTITTKNVTSEYTLKLDNSHGRRSTNKSKAHIKNKLLNVNVINSYNVSKNDSLEIIRKVNVDNKSVESSKIDLLEKEDDSSFHINNIHEDKSEATSRSKTENESFNKYVNSISFKDLGKARKLLKERYIDINEKNRELRDSVFFSSDISDFLLNPTVHTSTMNNVRDKLVKRTDKYLMNDKKTVDENDGDMKKLKENRSSVFNNLPVGLLALYPQPMKIGKEFLNRGSNLKDYYQVHHTFYVNNNRRK